MAYGLDKYQSRENRTRVRTLFMEQWDPIGVRGCEGAEDEYDTYADKAYVMLMQDRAAAETIADYLLNVATDRMGFSVDAGLVNASKRTAEMLGSMRPQFETFINE